MYTQHIPLETTAHTHRTDRGLRIDGCVHGKCGETVLIHDRMSTSTIKPDRTLSEKGPLIEAFTSDGDYIWEWVVSFSEGSIWRLLMHVRAVCILLIITPYYYTDSHDTLTFPGSKRCFYTRKFTLRSCLLRLLLGGVSSVLCLLISYQVRGVGGLIRPVLLAYYVCMYVYS